MELEYNVPWFRAHECYDHQKTGRSQRVKEQLNLMKKRVKRFGDGLLTELINPGGGGQSQTCWNLPFGDGENGANQKLQNSCLMTCNLG